MKKWICLITAIACATSSSVRADDAIYDQNEGSYEEAAATPGDEEEPATVEETPAPKQVGAVSAEAAQAARTSTAGKYILAAGAVLIGVAAIILVSRHHGHH